jgi:hypothetical protein
MSAAPVAATETIAPEVQQRLETESTALIARVNAIGKILTTEQYELAGQIGVEMATRIAEVTREFDGSDKEPGPCKRAYAAWKSITALRDKILKPLEAAKATAGQLMLAYSREQEAKRKAEEDRLRKEAEDAERARLKKEAEDAALAEAQRLQDQGNTAEAEAVLSAPVVVDTSAVYVPPVVVQSSTPTVQNAGARENWDFEIVDVNLIPREFMVPDEKSIRGVVKARKSLTNISGIRAYDKGSAVFKAKKG